MVQVFYIAVAQADFFQREPLFVSPELRLLSAPDVRRGALRRPARIVHTTLRRPTERDPFNAQRCRRRSGRCARVEKDVDGPTPRSEGFRRDQRGENWIFVVFAHRHDPHVDAILAHEDRQERVNALAEPLLLKCRLFAKRAERTLGRILRRDAGETERDKRDTDSKSPDRRRKAQSSAHEHGFYDASGSAAVNPRTGVGSAHYGRAAARNHQHAVVLPEDFIVEIDADHGVPAEFLRALLHLGERKLARFGQRPFIRC